MESARLVTASTEREIENEKAWEHRQGRTCSDAFSQIKDFVRVRVCHFLLGLRLRDKERDTHLLYHCSQHTYF